MLKRALSEAILKSQSKARLIPAPTATPLILAIAGVAGGSKFVHVAESNHSIASSSTEEAVGGITTSSPSVSARLTCDRVITVAADCCFNHTGIHSHHSILNQGGIGCTSVVYLSGNGWHDSQVLGYLVSIEIDESGTGKFSEDAVNFLLIKA